jgi:ATP synthase F1 epsilon subunit|tara:strand:- start:221 stop:610 length:390 start_codon:yes stop_codon:yes gene_type:complete
MSDNFNIEIVSPEKKLLTDKVNSVTIPSFEGEMTILLNHIPLITFLRPGIVKINASKEIQYFLEEGTVEFSNNNLTILSSTIIEVSALSRERISKMIEDSKNQLNQENLNDKTRYVVSHKIDCLSRINL